MSAQIDVLTAGYVGDRVASTSAVIRDGALVAVVDPGMVSDRVKILGPLNELGLEPALIVPVHGAPFTPSSATPR